jgi:putative aminopeptidase FrvX
MRPFKTTTLLTTITTSLFTTFAAAVIGLARRYSHSAVEMFDLSDVQAIIDLTVQTTQQLTNRSQLLRI